MRECAAIISVFLATWGCAFPSASAEDLFGNESDLLLLLEYGKLHITSPHGGEVRELKHGSDIRHVRGLKETPTLVVVTANGQGQPIAQELSLDGKVMRQTSLPKAFQYSVSPSGDQLLYVEFDRLSIRDLRAGITRQLLHENDTTIAGYFDLVWSPDQRLVAFTRMAEPDRELDGRSRLRVQLVGTQNGQPVEVGPNNRTQHPAFSPNGHYLAYWQETKSSPDPEWELYVQDLSRLQETDSQVKIATRALRRYSQVGLLCWSPDGNWLLWGEVNDRGKLLGLEPFYNLYKIQVDGTGLQGVSIHRPWWYRVWREIWPPEGKRGAPSELHWWLVPSSPK